MNQAKDKGEAALFSEVRHLIEEARLGRLNLTNSFLMPELLRRCRNN